jgi:glycosyltransferase involved in cell wall biosynthesis
MSELIQGRDIVIVGLQAWDVDIGSNCKNIAEEFARHNRVLYVNPPLDRHTIMHERDRPEIQRRLRILEGKEEGLVEISDNLWNFFPSTVLESINRIPVGFIFDLMNKNNNAKYAIEIKKAMQRLGFSKTILFNDNDIFRSFYLKELLSPDCSVYYIRDYVVAVDYWKKHGTRLEPKLFRKSDLVVANSNYLADYGRKYNPESHFVGQGCDVSHFDETKVKECPADLAAVPEPRIGYVGALFSLRLDIDLLEYLAAEKPEWNIVLVGPEDEKFKNSKLHQMKNVFFLGRKDMSELPSYIKYFNVCLNPQVVNAVTVGNYPRKIDEYLAMGKATVATKTAAMDIFADYTYQPETKEEYIPAIEKALREDSPEKHEARKKFAAQHTWENNVLAIYRCINKVKP